MAETKRRAPSRAKPAHASATQAAPAAREPKASASEAAKASLETDGRGPCDGHGFQTEWEYDGEGPAADPGLFEALSTTRAEGRESELRIRCVDTRSQLQERVDEALAPLPSIIGKLASLAQATDQKVLSDAARVLEGLNRFLGELSLVDPERQARLARAASALVGRKSKLPVKPGDFTAADALVDELDRVYEFFEKEFRGTMPSAEFLAQRLVRARDANENLGAVKLLPFEGANGALEALFKQTIAKALKDNKRPDLDGLRTLVSACARKCGNKAEVFGRVRKRERREDLK